MTGRERKIKAIGNGDVISLRLPDDRVCNSLRIVEVKDDYVYFSKGAGKARWRLPYGFFMDRVEALATPVQGEGKEGSGNG